MVISRVSTFTQHQSLIFDYQRVQNNIFDIQRQISSGKVANIYEDLNGKVERVSAFENKLKNVEQYMDTNTLTIARLESMGSVVDEIIKVADEVQNVLGLARSATQVQYPIFAQDIKGKLDKVAALLNTSIAGRHLFSGGKTDTRPVQEPIPANVTDGVPDAGYYNGNAEVLNTRATENLLIDYGVKADNLAFQQLITGMNYAIKQLQTPGAKGGDLDASVNLLNNASNNLNAVRSSISGNIVILQDANDLHDSTATYFRGVIGADVATDIVAASTELAVNQGILQASFQAFSGISSLRLVDFLR